MVGLWTRDTAPNLLKQIDGTSPAPSVVDQVNALQQLEGRERNGDRAMDRRGANNF